MARAWGLHPDQLTDTDARTYSAMLAQLADEHHQRSET